MTRTVQVALPDPVWGRLASRADDSGVTVADLISTAVAALVPPTSVDPVVTLTRSGLSDKEIAAQLVLTNAQVKTRRLAAGIPANRWNDRKNQIARESLARTKAGNE